MKFRPAVLTLFLLLAAAGVSGQQFVQRCTPFVNTSGTAFQTASCVMGMPLTPGNRMVVFVGFGTQNAAISGLTEASDPLIEACRFWDQNHRQGLAVLTGTVTVPAKKLTMKFGASVQYVTVAAHESSGTGEVEGCQVSNSPPTISASKQDYVATAALEISSGHDDVFNIPEGFVLRTNAGKSAGYADASGILAGDVTPRWAVTPNTGDLLAALVALKPNAVTIGGRMVYSDGSPYKATIVLYVTGSPDFSAGTATTDQNGVFSLTLVPDVTKAYRAEVIDASGQKAFDVASLSLSPQLARMELMALQLCSLNVTIDKETGRYVVTCPPR